MTKWKPEAGEDAVVRVLGLLTTTDGQYHAQIERSRATIPIAALRPLPAALSAEDALREPSEEEVRKVSLVLLHTSGAFSDAMRAALRDFLFRRRSTPPDPTPKESMAETLWPFIKHSMRGCERMEWAKVNRGSAAWDMAMHAAEAALSALGDRGRG